MYSWMHPSLEVRENGTFGKGVYAVTGIPKGECVTVFGGYVMSLKDEERLPGEIIDYAHQISDTHVIGINREEDIQPVDHYNHSCEPNAGFRGQIVLETMRDITPNEQVTFDYAMTLAEAPGIKPYDLACECGTLNCRKVITDSDWRIPEIQEKYRGYFQQYIADKIEKLNS
jgi:hypothetical protein